MRSHIDGTFQRVISSLFFHHLTWPDKEHAARETFRVLAPGGELHVADWGRAEDVPAGRPAVPLRRSRPELPPAPTGLSANRDRPRDILRREMTVRKLLALLLVATFIAGPTGFARAAMPADCAMTGAAGSDAGCCGGGGMASCGTLCLFPAVAAAAATTDGMIAPPAASPLDGHPGLTRSVSRAPDTAPPKSSLRLTLPVA